MIDKTTQIELDVRSSLEKITGLKFGMQVAGIYRYNVEIVEGTNLQLVLQVNGVKISSREKNKVCRTNIGDYGDQKAIEKFIEKASQYIFAREVMKS